jgi:hypothetical protein
MEISPAGGNFDEFPVSGLTSPAGKIVKHPKPHQTGNFTGHLFTFATLVYE